MTFSKPATMPLLQNPPIPYKRIMTSLPFYAILFAHMGQNYGYETLMTELPTYMKQVLRFSIKEVSWDIRIWAPEAFCNCCPVSPPERHTVRPTLPCHVALLHVHLRDRRLDDLVKAIHTHEHPENHQQYWSVWTGHLPHRGFLHRL